MCSSSIADLLDLTASTGMLGKLVSSTEGISAWDDFVWYCREGKTQWFLWFSKSMSPSGCTGSDFVYTKRVKLNHACLINLLTSRLLVTSLLWLV